MPTEEQTYREFVKQTLIDIKAQTIKTNGRVNALENENISAKVFRARITTAVGILSFIIGSMIIPLISSFIQSGKF